MPALHEVVVSGISGLFPESDDMDELCHNLFNKVDMVTADSRRWGPGELGVPAGTGKIKSRDLFDYQFFGVGFKLAESMDTATRNSLEQAFRAVCDSAVSVKDLYGSNTAVYVASSIQETEDLSFTNMKDPGTYSLLGNARTMQANRISFVFNFTGPSVSVNSCWNGGMEALEMAYHRVASGESNAAVVGCNSVMFTPHISYHFDAMGRLSKDGSTRCFSSDADGYARSEGCVFLFLQRAEHAKRSYGTILGVHSTNGGSSELNFTEFNQEKFKEHLKQTYTKAKVDPLDVAFYEACGTASKQVDAKELNAVAEVFLQKRQKPLLIGSVKSNLGHTEGASSLVALAKAIIALDKGTIPPNLHFSLPNEDVPALVAGKLKVVTESTPLEGEVIGVSSFGIAGAYSHVILKRNPKTKTNVPEAGTFPEDGLPRLVLLSDRDPDNMACTINKLRKMPVDSDFVDLMNNWAKDGVRNHIARGYCLLGDPSTKYQQVEGYEPGKSKRPVWFVFSGMGSQWPGMAKTLMRLPVFANAIHKCHQALLPKGVNLINIITTEDPTIFEKALNAFIGIAAVQIGLTDVLSTVGVAPDGIVGHSLGELGCAYADGCFTTEEMILSAYARGKASTDAILIRGMMAAVGIGYTNLRNFLPDDIEIACHNSKDSCTISGPVEDIKEFVSQLKAKGIFTKLVNVGDIAFHSKHIQPAGKLLRQYLEEVIQEPKERSSRWISSSIPEGQWNTDLARYSSAEYHVNNMLSPVLFEEASSSFIPPDAILIEIAPHGLMQSILKGMFPTAVHIPLTSRFDGNNLNFLLSALGKLYTAGVTVNVNKLYPPVEYPVPRATPYVSPFVGWSHKEVFEPAPTHENDDLGCWRIANVNLSKDEFCNLAHHKLGNRFIIPNSFYVDQIISLFTKDNATSGTGVVIQDLTFDNFIEASYQTDAAVTFKVLKGTGEFCVTGNRHNVLLARGKIRKLDVQSINMDEYEQNSPLESSAFEINGHQLLSLLQYEGLELTNSFAVIKEVIIGESSMKATITWNGKFPEFLNSIFTVVGFYIGRNTQTLVQIKSIRELVVDVLELNQLCSDVVVEYCTHTKSVHCRGVRMVLHETAPFRIESIQEDAQFSSELLHFVPYENSKVCNASQMLDLSAQIIMENVHGRDNHAIRVVVVEDFLREAAEGVFENAKYAPRFEVTYATEAECEKRISPESVHGSVLLVVSSTKVGSFYCESSSTPTYILEPHFEPSAAWTVVSRFEFEGAQYTLARRFEEIHHDIVHIGVDDSVLQQKLFDAYTMNKESNQCSHFVIVAGAVCSLAHALEVIEQSSSKDHYNLLRYMLVEGEEVNIVNDQIPQCTRVNLNRMGVWGSLRTFPAESAHQAPSDDVFTKLPVHDISSIVPSKEIVALGVNLGDLTGSVEDDFIKVFDYATSTVVGLARYDPVYDEFVEDDILKWARPLGWSSWTDTEAATVPVLYSLAAYIVHIVNNQVPSNTILINRGMIPLSQALISLSLSVNLDVYVTVFGTEEKKQLLHKFPRLKCDQVFDCNTSSFHVPILKHTQGKGVYKVVNTFPDDGMVGACVKCTATRGVYVQVSAAPIIKNSKLGMLFFDNEVIACGATVDIVTSLEVEQKMEIKDFVNNALVSGYVDPIDNVFVLPSNISNIDAAKQMSFLQSKVVVDLSRRVMDMKEVFACKPDVRYVIIGELPHNYFWLKLTEWLLRRGAKTIDAVLKTAALSPEISLVLQSLNKRYPVSKVHVHPAAKLSSKAEAKRFVNSVVGTNPSLIFLIGSAVNEASAFIEVLQNEGLQSELVCLGKGGERLSEKLKNGLTSITIKCTPAVLESSGFFQRLDWLIVEARKHSMIIANRYPIHRFSNRDMNEWKRIPATLNELQEFSKMTGANPGFVELESCSARLARNKECDPVFVFPGLRPDRTRRIALRLTYPVLVARLPKGFTDLDSMASDLACQLASRRQNLFTLIGIECGGTLALLTALKLQNLGKLATVILLDGAPGTTRRWASKLLTDDVGLLAKYTTLPLEVVTRAKESTTWGSKTTALQEFCDVENLRIVDEVSILKNRLQEVFMAKPLTQRIRTLSHLFCLEPMDELDSTELNEYLGKTPSVHLKEAASITEMIDKAIDDINSLVLYEQKDAAHHQPEPKIGGEAFLNLGNVPSFSYKAKMIADEG